MSRPPPWRWPEVAAIVEVSIGAEEPFAPGQLGHVLALPGHLGRRRGVADALQILVAGDAAEKILHAVGIAPGGVVARRPEGGHDPFGPQVEDELITLVADLDELHLGVGHAAIGVAPQFRQVLRGQAVEAALVEGVGEQRPVIDGVVGAAFLACSLPRRQ